MKNVCDAIRKYVISGRYIVAVSGGADSVALADACIEIARVESDYTFRFVHVEHGMRGEESLSDAFFVEQFFVRHGLDFAIRHVDVKKRVTECGESLEEAARKLRYRVLSEEAVSFGARRIITAHHANDQAETMLLRLIRGAGCKGFGCMQKDNGIVIRPFLGLTKESLLEYCRKRCLMFIDDSSNDDLHLTRNFVRHKIFPLINQINPNCIDVICREAENFREDEVALSALAVQLGNKLISGRELCTRDWSLYSVAIRKRVIRDWLGKMRCTVSGRHIADIDKLILNGTSQKVLALPGVTVKYAYHRLYVEFGASHIRR